MSKNKIAIIADIPNWSFDIIAQLLKKELSDKYDIDVFYCVTDFNKDLFDILEATKEYDVIHFLARKLLLQFEDESFKERVALKGYNYDEYLKSMVRKITTCVYDHLAINDPEIDYTKLYRLYSKAYLVCSKKLYDIYAAVSNCPLPWAEIPDTIDTDLFVPAKLERFDSENVANRPLVIGWVGNSKWNKKSEDDIDYKGLHTILKPAIDELKAEGYNIEPFYADVNDKYRNAVEMQEYYSNIDIYVCVSLIEGTPRPLLESMSCGVPVITTDVGLAYEVLGKKGQEFILKERNKEELKEKIKELYNNRELLKVLSEENIKEGAKNSSKCTVEKYIELFDGIINDTL